MRMPIKGMSEIRRLPRLGKIRLGIKTQSEKGSEYPKAVDYFVCKQDQTTSAAAVEAFHAVYGDKPRTLDIMFPVENIDQFFQQWYRRYGKGTGLKCKGDGERAMRVNEQSGELEEIACEPATCQFAQTSHCRAVGSLQFMLPKVPGLGVWQIDTGSYNSIVNVNSGIEFVRGMTQGRIAWIPLQLSIVPREAQVEGRKKTIYVLDLTSMQTSVEAILRAARQAPGQYLLPAVNLDEIPDDLYPATVVKETQVVGHTEAGLPVDANGEVLAPRDKLAVEESSEEMIRLWDALGTPDEKRRTWMARPDFSVAATVEQLRAELAKRSKPKQTEAKATDEKPTLSKPIF